jgi:hypothetical protein
LIIFFYRRFKQARKAIALKKKIMKKRDEKMIQTRDRAIGMAVFFFVVATAGIFWSGAAEAGWGCVLRTIQTQSQK